MPSEPEPVFVAVLVRAGQHDAASVRRAVQARGYGDVWLRALPIDGVGWLRVEVQDGAGAVLLDPMLVHALSLDGECALFTHFDERAGVGMIHAFQGGHQIEGWAGDAAEARRRFSTLVGHDLSAVAAADEGAGDGARAGTETVALVRGRSLDVPPGTPTIFGSFAFHDEGADLDGGDRVALLALDARALADAWRSCPGHELAARALTLPEAVLGPLRTQVDEAVAALREAGDRPPEAAGLRSIAALEIVALGEACFFAGGQPVPFVEDRLFPMFGLSPDPPVFDDADLAELEAAPSVLAAMAEVLPSSSPGGSLLDPVSDDEVRPAAPWAGPGEDHAGSLFLLDGERLRRLLAGADKDRLAERVDRFFAAWWCARHDPADQDGFRRWRDEIEARGGGDAQRFRRAWLEWLAVLDLAAANRLTPALLFYGG